MEIDIQGAGYTSILPDADGVEIWGYYETEEILIHWEDLPRVIEALQKVLEEHRQE